MHSRRSLLRDPRKDSAATIILLFKYCNNNNNNNNNNDNDNNDNNNNTDDLKARLKIDFQHEPPCGRALKHRPSKEITDG